MDQSIAKNRIDDSLAQLDRLSEIAQDVIKRCRAAGASDAEVGASIDVGLAVNARLGEVETIEHTRDRSVGVTVYFGKRKGSASTADLQPDSIAKTVEHAIAIARYTEEDPAAGLADPALLARDFPDLDLWHPWASMRRKRSSSASKSKTQDVPSRNHQFRRRYRTGWRVAFGLREFARFPRPRAFHAAHAVVFADRRRRSGHAARLLV